MNRLWPPHLEEAEYNKSMSRSLERRALAREHRGRERRAAVVAVIGVVILIWFVTREWPVEYWFAGILGVVSIIPYIVLRLERGEQ